MELKNLKTFLAVIDCGGVIAAAERLNTVQSNVTSRIKKLEQELGEALFYRQGKGLGLSNKGRELEPYARELIHLEQSAKEQLCDHSPRDFRLGSMEAFAAFLLPRLIPHFRRQYPELPLHIETDTSSALVEKVLKRKLNAAIVGGAVKHPQLVTKPLLRETLVHVCPKGPWTVRGEETLLCLREGCAYRARSQHWLKTQGTQHFRTMELGTLEGILGCISTGVGSTLLPERLIDSSPYRERLITHAIPKTLAQMDTLLIYPKEEDPAHPLSLYQARSVLEEDFP